MLLKNLMLFLELKKNQNSYILPDEIINVRNLNRRTVGSELKAEKVEHCLNHSTLAYTNTYLLSRCNRWIGNLLRFRIIPRNDRERCLEVSYSSILMLQQKKLTITQRPRADDETVLMHTDNFRPDIHCFKDIYSKPWIRDYTLAVSKIMLGEARGKFNT